MEYGWEIAAMMTTQQNSTMMLILNNFHNKNKFQAAKKLADENHEIHSFKYIFGSNVIGRVKHEFKLGRHHGSNISIMLHAMRSALSDCKIISIEFELA